MARGVFICGVGVETVLVGNVGYVLVGDADGAMDGESLCTDD